MTHQYIADGDALAQIPDDESIEVIGTDGAYDTRPCYAVIATRGATPSIPPCEGTAHCSAGTMGAIWRNAAVEARLRRSTRMEAG